MRFFSFHLIKTTAMLPHTKTLRAALQPSMRLRSVREEDVRKAVKRHLEDGDVQFLAVDAVSEDYAKERVREWAKIEELLGVHGAAHVRMEPFLALCMSMAPHYCTSKLEKMRGALVWRQIQELEPTMRWSRDERFLVGFKGAKKSCRPFAERGAISETKLSKLVQWLTQKGLTMYARGFVVAFYGLLRHSDVIRMRWSDVEFGAEILLSIIGGKGREKEHVDEVRATEARLSLEAAVAAAQGHGLLLFPGWNKAFANDLIREFAELDGWDKGQKWTVHSLRHGFAAKLKRDGVCELARKQRGRWSSSRVAEWYARGP